MRVVWAIAAAKLVVQLVFASRYGSFGDEMYHLACGEHLDWGYIDQPPLIALIAWTGEGWLYMAAVMDLYSRRIVGWSTADHLATGLCLDALQRALGHRTDVDGLIHHSDRGVQYASIRYREALDAHGIVCSMSRRANCWDNAVAESFFGTLKNELIDRRPWSTRVQARDAIGEYIEIFYNRIQRHSTVGSMSPAKFEEMAQAKEAWAA